MKETVLEARRVSYVYRTRHRTVQALNEVSYRFASGTVYAVVGKSGCGKSTLISVLAGLYLPSMGYVLCHGKDTLTLDRTLHRRHDVAVIYQNYNLFPLMTVMENVLYPLRLQQKKKKEARALAERTLRSVGLSPDYYNRLPAMLSGGEQQRVAVARAVAGGQKIILADEPTGNLDEENSRNVMEMLKRLAHEEDYCVIVVTHDPQVAAESDAVIRMSSGRIVGE
ncbi:MAG: ABC transporter ATP-binding protein [Clostridia bacterium]|nr:ABC transporter ATP-binding protein [Clostridia bacterium]